MLEATRNPGEKSTINATVQSGGKSEDYTGAIAGGITGGLIFIAIVVVIVLLVQRRTLREQYRKSFRVTMGRANKYCEE